jgi:hypothetical protein
LISCFCGLVLVLIYLYLRKKFQIIDQDDLLASQIQLSTRNSERLKTKEDIKEAVVGTRIYEEINPIIELEELKVKDEECIICLE